MKFAVAHYDWDFNRKGDPYLFTVEGEPEGEAEWKQFGGKTRETMTLAEIEAKGISLPAAFAATNAETAKRLQTAEAEITALREHIGTVNTKLFNAKKALE